MDKIFTYTKSRRALRLLGMTLRKVDGEFRVYRLGERDTRNSAARIYYTNDLYDAVNTAYAILAEDARIFTENARALRAQRNAARVHPIV